MYDINNVKVIYTEQYQDLKSEYSKIQKELAFFDKLMDTELPKTIVNCKFCKVEHQIKDLVYIQTYYYISPYSCAGGDYWVPKNGEFKCIDCGYRNKFFRGKGVDYFKEYFSKSVDEY